MHKAVMRALRTTLVLALVTAPLSGADESLEAREEQAFKQAAALVSPSIVRIQTVGGLDRVGRVMVNTGPTTGLVLSKDGYVITSSFNFAARPASILVQTAAGRRFPARQIAADHSKMLTLIKIDATDLVPSRPAPRTDVKVGQWAIALGRAYDSPQPSVSVGIVSAVDRVWGKAIQTDAKVSPVNYGGPLVDVKGRVMGVLVPLSTRGSGETAGVEWYDSGIGFAVPLQDILATFDRLKTGKDLHAGLMGVSFKSAGVLGGEAQVDRVRVNSPAAKAGLKAGDRITAVDGKPIASQNALKHALGRRYAGEKITLTLNRDKETLERELTLVAELTPWEAGFLGVLPVRQPADSKIEGVDVRFVFAGSPAAGAGVQKRDRIVKFNGSDVTNAEALADLVGRLRPGQQAELVFERSGAPTTVSVKLASIPAAIPDDLLPTIIPPAAEPADKKQAPKTGRFTFELPEHKKSCWAYVPADYNPQYRYGLVVWLHPGGDTMEAAMMRSWKRLCDRRGLMLLAPKAGKLAGFGLDEAEFVKDALADFVGKYSIDPSRVCLHGYGDGGTFAFNVAFAHREQFPAIATASALPRTRLPENDPATPQQLLLVCGEKDRLLAATKRAAAILRRAKFPVSLLEPRAAAREYPSGETLERLASWVDMLDRI